MGRLIQIDFYSRNDFILARQLEADKKRPPTPTENWESECVELHAENYILSPPARKEAKRNPLFRTHPPLSE